MGASTPFLRNGITGLDRSKYINVHSSPGNADWRPEDIDLFANTYGANLGRAFVFSSRMSQCKNDPSNPMFVDPVSLTTSCEKYPLALDGWPVAQVDLIHSSKTAQLYSNGCGAGRPTGFVPGSHASTADFFGLFYQQCMMPTQASRYLIEVANECEVKAELCDTTFEEMIQLHVSVADHLHSVAGGQKQAVVCGPTAAFPEFQLGNFSQWAKGMGAFIREAGPSMDGISVHIYSTFWASNNTLPSPRSGSNANAILDMQEAASALARPGRGPLPVLASEFGGGFLDKPVEYLPIHDWLVLREVNALTMQYMERPDRVLKAVPFIVGKATWDNDTKADPSLSYPWALWRWNRTISDWQPTHLHKHYQLWAGVNGSARLAQSSSANVLVHAWEDDSSGRWWVALHNLGGTADDVALQWAPAAGLPSALNVTGNILQLDEALLEPVLSPVEPSAELPASVVLPPHATAVLCIEAAATASPPPSPSGAGGAVQMLTFHAGELLRPLATPQTLTFPAAACPANHTPMGAQLRLTLGGDAGAFAAAEADWAVSANGERLAVDYATGLGGQLHVSAKDASFFAALAVAVPPSAFAARGAGAGVTVSVEVSTSAGAQLTLAAGVMDMLCSEA